MTEIAVALLLLIVERLAARTLELSIWQWIGVQTILFTVLPLIFITVTRIKREEVGLSIGDFPLGLRYVVVLLFLAMPFMVYGAMQPSFKLYYPLWAPARLSILNFIFFELAVLVMMFNTEFLFRGFLLFSLERKLKDRWAAIILQAVPYMLVHIGKPGLEVPYSFFVGIVFGWLALKTRSIAPSTAAHWTSSVIFDAMVIVL